MCSSFVNMCINKTITTSTSCLLLLPKDKKAWIHNLLLGHKEGKNNYINLCVYLTLEYWNLGNTFPYKQTFHSFFYSWVNGLFICDVWKCLCFGLGIPQKWELKTVSKLKMQNIEGKYSFVRYSINLQISLHTQWKIII